jgi:hypothetical protein
MLANFMTIWSILLPFEAILYILWSFLVCLPILIFYANKNLATLVGRPLFKQEGSQILFASKLLEKPSKPKNRRKEE